MEGVDESILQHGVHAGSITELGRLSQVHAMSGLAHALLATGDHD